MRKKEDVSVVMLPWSAFGHLIPFFNLSVALASVGGLHVSFISTPRNIKRLPKVLPHLAHLVKLVEFPLPALDDKSLLPEGAEATVDITAEKLQYLKAAYDLLQDPIKQFIAAQKPDWIIADFAPHWIIEFANDHDIPIVYFSVYAAAALSFSIDVGASESILEGLTSTPSNNFDFPSTLSYRKFEALDIISLINQEDASGVCCGQRLTNMILCCDAIGIRSCNEFEADYLDALHKLVNKPVIPVGLLPPEKSPEKFNCDDPSWQKIFKWLDQQKPKSILFVGFGSEYKLRNDQINEIAYGLELSGIPFLWILQKPIWVSGDVDPLPAGFRTRTVEKGVVSIGWAPQKDILAHPSIGGTLAHGGLGSNVETLQHGHVIVALPFIADQGLNARFLVEKELGVEVERNEEDGSFTRNDIAKAVIYVMVSKEGEELRARARQVAPLFVDYKLHESYIASFVEYLKDNRN